MGVDINNQQAVDFAATSGDGQGRVTVDLWVHEAVVRPKMYGMVLQLECPPAHE